MPARALTTRLSRVYPVVKEMAETTGPERIRVSVTVAARVLGFSKQAYYKWRAKPVSDRQASDMELLAAIREIWEDDPELGHRLIAWDLQAAGWRVSDRRVWRICSANGVFSLAVRKRRGAPGKPARTPAEDDHVKRVFTAGVPNRVWLTDITEHKTSQGKLYLCAVKDVFSNQIVGWAIGKRMRAPLAVAALTDAWMRRGRPHGTIIHSDRGSQFGSKRFVEACEKYGLTRSMGQARTCADNAAMESFFALLQKNVLNQRKTWTSRAELRAVIVRWIERTYNRRRRQHQLGKLTPVEYETIHTQTLQLAA